MVAASVQNLRAARWEFLPRASDDSLYLKRWRYVPITYVRAQESEGGAWHVDHHETPLGADPSGELFHCIADRLMHYQFYPTTLIEPTSDFGLAQRALRVGDRIVQRVHVLRLRSWRLVDFLSINEVSEVTDEPRRKGFAYVTTRGHSEYGEWSAHVEWREDERVMLIVHAVSRFSETVPRIGQFFARRLQLYAHKQGIANVTPTDMRTHAT